MLEFVRGFVRYAETRKLQWSLAVVSPDLCCEVPAHAPVADLSLSLLLLHGIGFPTSFICRYYPLFGLMANVALIFSGQYVKYVSGLRSGLPTGKI